MLETAIVGAGLCGLKLAHSLQAQGRDFALFEARNRPGGRILSVPSEIVGMALDMGPTWFWPQTQPRISRLVNDLGLISFPQHDTGEVLNLTDHDKKPDPLKRPNLHGAPTASRAAWPLWYRRSAGISRWRHYASGMSSPPCSTTATMSYCGSSMARNGPKSRPDAWSWRCRPGWWRSGSISSRRWMGRFARRCAKPIPGWPIRPR